MISDVDFLNRFQNFIKNHILSTDSIVLPETRILGPYQYNRAQLIAVGFQDSNDSSTTFSDALVIFCTNQSSNSKLEKKSNISDKFNLIKDNQ